VTYKLNNEIINHIIQFKYVMELLRFVVNSEYDDRLCGLVVRVPGYRSRGPGSIPALPDFLRSSGSGTGFTQPREYN
jgi:hypothetical protein